MSGQDDSEERPLPPSKKKLDDARKKGQVASSRDMVSGTALAGVLCLLLLGAAGFVASGTGLLRAAGIALDEHAAGHGLVGLGHLRAAARDAALATVVPAFGIALGLAVLSAIVVLKGIPFSMQPVSPNLSKLNPVEGAKRIVSMRSLIELVKAMLKALLIAAVLTGILIGGLGALVQVPAHGMEGVRGAVQGLFTPMLVAAIALFLVAGLADVGLQNWLFRRDMRMSLTEQKRERKEQEGDPLVRNARRRLMRSAAGAPPVRTGLRHATLLVTQPDGPAIAIRFVRGETPVPAVVARGAHLVTEAARAGIPTVEDAALAAALARRAPPGSFVPQDLFQKVAAALVRVGAL
ncbi:translocation protein in type III secretion system, RhcU [Roseomonas hellenica]|uniref:Translocation protein in type III secretion system, RhcU n=1 Tax=Plastoroseomonas hellenica TaxID=2687306 RepID=A0ABS5ERI3_9PROT|nr:EscU/YscU/HrcU family type III secretion system export apparatus switch protein [Plastoroseomonas hellenica]MBR0662907.1 translocation protein in type III secretion system, RhcU [Plastoroseomonas hellenica]